MIKKFTLLLAVIGLFSCSWAMGQSVCGVDGGTIAAPGAVTAGTLEAPCTTMLADGSDADLCAFDTGCVADNGGIYPCDAELPAVVNLANGDSTQDYNYVIEVPDGNGGTILISSLDGTFNPADPAGDGSIPAMVEGDQACVAGFAFSISQVNNILDFVQNPFICPIVEPAFPEGISCDPDVYDIPQFESIEDVFGLAAIFGLVVTDVPSAITALGTIENLLTDNGFETITPCYAVTNWNDAAVSAASIIGAQAEDSTFEEDVAAVAEGWGGYSYCITIGGGVTEPDCDAFGGTIECVCDTNLSDGSDQSSCIFDTGCVSDNGTSYPCDAVLPAVEELANGPSSQDYDYIIGITYADGTTALTTSSDGTCNIPDPAGDGSLPALQPGDSYCIAGFSYSLSAMNNILDFVQNPFICPIVEPAFPEGITCADDVYPIEQFESIQDVFALTAVFGLEVTSIPSALTALGTVENLLADNGFEDLIPCYHMTNWPTDQLASQIITDQGPDATFEENVAAVADVWDGYSCCVDIISACEPFAGATDVSTCDGASVVFDDTTLEAGSVTDFTYTSVEGCDSIVTVTVINNISTTNSLEEFICEGDILEFEGEFIPAGESADFTYVNAAGCDSVLTLSAVAIPTYTETVNLAACTDQTVEFDGTPLGPNVTQDFTYVTIEGCDSIITVIVDEIIVNGGTISTLDATTVCLGDGQTINVVAEGNEGTSYAYIVTDEAAEVILDGPTIDPVFNFDGAPPGTCQIWGVAYDGDLNIPSDQVGDITGCFDLSNSITVTRLDGDSPECTDCPPAPAAPAAANLCSGGTATFVIDLPEGVSINWSDASGSTVGSEGTLITAELVNNNCAPVSYTFAYEVLCLDNGAPILFGDVSATVYPTDIAGFLTATGDGTCSTAVEVSADCGPYVSVTAPQTAGPGEVGEHEYLIAYDYGASGLECVANGSIFIPFDCPAPPCDANAGTLVADAAEACYEMGGSVTISATEGDAPVVPDGSSVLYVLTQGADLVIVGTNDAPSFDISEAGDYTIHTLVYDPTTLDLSIVELGVTTGVDVLNIVTENEICASLLVAGAQTSVTECVVPCDAASGTLVADAAEACYEMGGSVTISATEGDAPVVPDGYSVLYVLTQGADLVIVGTNDAPSFDISEAGDYTIHTLVYDPMTLDLSIVEPGVTTGVDVLNIVTENEICASLLVAGAQTMVSECPPPGCDAASGTLVADAAEACYEMGGSVTISATEGDAPVVPDGYSVLYVLTQGADLVIVGTNDAPSFDISEAGDYTIHTLVYDPMTLDLSIVEPGVTTGVDVLNIVTENEICASLLVAGAQTSVTECPPPGCDAASGTLVADAAEACYEAGASVTISATEGDAPVVPDAYSVLYVLTQGADLVIVGTNDAPSFDISEAGDYTIHTLVYDPATLDLGVVVPGLTTGVDVLNIVTENEICASLLVAGAQTSVTECVVLLTGTVSGTVYNDANENGEQDDDEDGLSGTIVVLVGAGDDGEFGTDDDTSDSFGANDDGTYIFEDVPAGDYYVSFNTPDPFGDGSSDTFTITGDGAELVFDFSGAISGECANPIVLDINFDCNDGLETYDAIVNISGGFPELNGGTYTVNGSFNGEVEDGLTLIDQDFLQDFTLIVTDNVGCQEEISIATPCDKPQSVELIDFSGKVDTDANILDWTTATELNNDYFVLMFSEDGINFSPLTQVMSFGDSNVAQSYSYTHTNPVKGSNYYRLDQVDTDGLITTSEIIMLYRGQAESAILEIAPNPANNNVNLQLDIANAQALQLNVYSIDGSLMIERGLEATAGQNIFNLDISHFNAGVYVITLTDGNEMMIKQLIKE